MTSEKDEQRFDQHKKIVQMINLFRIRSTKQQWRSFFFLFLILSALAAGGFIFVFASKIVTADLATNKENLRTDIHNTQTSLNLIDGQYNNTYSRYDDAKARNEVDTIKLWKRLTSLKLKRAETVDILRDLQNRQKTLEAEVGEDYSTNRLISTTTTRFVSILLLLFLIKIMIPEHRYCVRLSAYYDARADALELILSDVYHKKDIEILLNVLTPKYEFGESPQTPQEQILDLVKLVKKT